LIITEKCEKNVKKVFLEEKPFINFGRAPLAQAENALSHPG
jgi:hypothetical protein